MFLQVVQYFGEPAGQAKIQRPSKNIQQYYMLKYQITYLLSNCFHCEFCKHIVYDSVVYLYSLFGCYALFELYQGHLDNKYYIIFREYVTAGLFPIF